MTAAANNSLLSASHTPRRWPLAALAVGVLAVHAMVLQATAFRWDVSATPTRPVGVAPLQTRRIEPAAPAPPPRPSPAPSTPPKPSAAPAKRFSAPKQLAAQAEQPYLATDSIANQSAAALAPNTEDAPAEAMTEPASAAAAPAPTQASVPPVPVSLAPSAVLTYKMTGSAKGLDYHANAELVWRHEGSRYDARMTVSVLFLGARSMSSVGEVGADGLAPTRFTDKSRSEYAAHFEPDKGLITFSANTPPAPWVRGAQDRVSVFLQLGGLLAGNPVAYPVGTTVAVYTTGPRAADTWTFRVEHEETLALPLGEVRTIKLARQPQREYDQRVEVWLAPALGYLPVRNKITQSNGDFIDQQLSALVRP